MDGYLGEIRLFSFQKVPVNWALCDGTILQVSQNQALFSLLGPAFGGNGTTTFGLPDLRGRVPVQAGGGPAYRLGTTGGCDTVALDQSQLPIHNHLVNVDRSEGTQSVGTGAIPAAPAKVHATDPDAPLLYGSGSGSKTALDPSVIGVSGGGQAHENRQPFQAINYCICVRGVYPSRP